MENTTKETSTKGVSENGKKAKLLYGYEGAARALNWIRNIILAIGLVGVVILSVTAVKNYMAVKQEQRTWFYGTWKVKMPKGEPMYFVITPSTIKSHIPMPGDAMEVEGTYSIDGDKMEITWPEGDNAVLTLDKEKDQIITANGIIGTRSKENEMQDSDNAEQSKLKDLQELLKKQKSLMEDILADAKAVQNPYSDFNTREYNRRDIASKLPKLERATEDLVSAYKKAGMQEDAETAQRGYDKFMAGVRGLRGN